MLSIGMDLGNSSVKVAVISEEKEIKYKKYKFHYGKPISVLMDILLEVSHIFADEKISYGAATGVNAALLPGEFMRFSDIPAIEMGLKTLCPDVRSAIEIGSQNGRFLRNLSKNSVPIFSVNEGCAGGTGSFFEDQMYRLGLNIEDYSNLVEKATSIPRLSGRCSVFAKTDIIHRQQEGVSTEDILLGLCYATIRNFKATIIKNMPVEKPLALCGGITLNKAVIRAVKDIFELSEEELFVSEDTVYIQAIGAAAIALEQENEFSFNLIITIGKENRKEYDELNNLLRLHPLKLFEGTNLKDPECKQVDTTIHCTMGIDVGSTSTNLVLTDSNGEIVDFQYLRTKGDPQSVVREGLYNIKKKFEDKVIIEAVGVTGSGRYLIGKMIGADTIKDEITAQARAAISANPEVDTVFEIGGQDSKYISINNCEVIDFQMNKICAAGTGSFIEEQANRLQVSLSEYGKMALASRHPVDLGERCTVFIESNISSCLSKGVEKEDILAGLCHSVIHNYLFKVVGNKPVGKNIVLQGGVCYNPAVVAAFQAVYGEAITVSPCFSVSGAYGVSLIAGEEMNGKKTIFKGLDLLGEETGEKEEDVDIISKNITFYEQAKRSFIGDYTGHIDPGKETIGVPYVLVVHKFFPMIKEYFETLGYNVLLSNETNENTIALAQKYAQAETCYPVKLIYGHMTELSQKGVDYIFLPSIITMKHECSHVHHNYGCVYMQTAPRLVFESMGLKEKGIRLINPFFELDFGQKAMASAMIEVGVSLGKKKPLCVKALLNGSMAVRKHTTQVEKMGEELLADLKDDEKVLVIVTRNYGIEDPMLNMGMPQELLKRGYKVITLSHLPAHSMDISEEYENLYWPFGQHIISGAKLIRNHPNLYAVYLTNHGCGPDTMLAHLFRKEMKDKPYLNVEVDEHFSKVGVITRIEAFLNSLDNRKTLRLDGKDYFKELPKSDVSILKKPDKDDKLYIPYLYPHSMLIADILQKNGYKAEVLPMTSNTTLALGKRKTISKEYLSFTALAGDILSKAQEGEHVQFLIPQTEGSEADGMYARVIYDMLETYKGVKVVAPTMETLPVTSSLCNQFYLCLLCGDIILSAEPGEREELMERILQFDSLSLDRLIGIIKMTNFKENSKKIMVVGEPYILFNSFLNNRLIDQMEAEGREILYMPLAEYFYFMWEKCSKSKKEKSIVAKYGEQMKNISDIMGKSSPYARNFSELCKIADYALPKFSGANGSYRIAKSIMNNGSKACIEVASTYENVQTIIELTSIKKENKTIVLNFEGPNDVAIKERLNSFLYYTDRN